MINNNKFVALTIAVFVSFAVLTPVCASEIAISWMIRKIPTGTARLECNALCSNNLASKSDHENPNDYCYLDWTSLRLCGDAKAIGSYQRHTEW